MVIRTSSISSSRAIRTSSSTSSLSMMTLGPYQVEGLAVTVAATRRHHREGMGPSRNSRRVRTAHHRYRCRSINSTNHSPNIRSTTRKMILHAINSFSSNSSRSSSRSRSRSSSSNNNSCPRYRYSNGNSRCRYSSRLHSP